MSPTPYPRTIYSGYMLDGHELYDGSVITIHMVDGTHAPYEAVLLEEGAFNGWYAQSKDLHTRMLLSLVKGVMPKGLPQ